MPGLLPTVDPEGLLEFSVVYTDRALNHMSRSFQGVMKDISTILKDVYKAHATALVPGSGTFGMESVARQFATGKDVMVLRNGWFSYRWTQIFEQGNVAKSHTVLKARKQASGSTAAWAPVPVAEVVAAIREQKPAAFFAPHVETAAGIILPDDYMRAIADAMHEVGGLFVLDCIASGAMWVDMKAVGVDVLISAPQKGWSSSPCCAMVCFSERARQAIDGTTSTSFSMDLKKWLTIMETYEGGAHMYHSTMPTDALTRLRSTMKETQAYGFAKVKAEQEDLGRKVRALFESRGFPSVAAEGFKAPGVVVSYTTDPDI
ncbi:MAG TPA: aminotransferase class V-fold PLP-dependent enzyme, partial [Ramlibacter sp.]|nr:aminotransferase class V-fold PLP-dependent enzyme [Ramlibacter sp.]